MAKLIEELSQRDRPHSVFADFCELSALSMSNVVDKVQFEAREERYMRIVKGYSAAEVEVFPKLLAHLVEWLSDGMDDCLGKLLMQLELGNHHAGQFFTPFSVSSLMPRISMGCVKKQVERDGFITVCEPACGAGGMVIAAAEAVMEQGVNYQKAMHVTAIDIDATAVHMTYLQLTLLHIPAIVVHGNALSLEQRAHWVTPAHVLGGWDWRLRKRAEQDRASEETRHEVPLLEIPESKQADASAAPDETIELDPAQIRAAVVANRLEQLDLFGSIVRDRGCDLRGCSTFEQLVRKPHECWLRALPYPWTHNVMHRRGG